jgi:hypothetical protein
MVDARGSGLKYFDSTCRRIQKVGLSKAGDFESGPIYIQKVRLSKAGI